MATHKFGSIELSVEAAEGRNDEGQAAPSYQKPEVFVVGSATDLVQGYTGGRLDAPGGVTRTLY
jgi:hypothetical protein